MSKFIVELNITELPPNCARCPLGKVKEGTVIYCLAKSDKSPISYINLANINMNRPSNCPIKEV